VHATPVKPPLLNLLAGRVPEDIRVGTEVVAVWCFAPTLQNLSRNLAPTGKRRTRPVCLMVLCLRSTNRVSSMSAHIRERSSPPRQAVSGAATIMSVIHGSAASNSRCISSATRAVKGSRRPDLNHATSATLNGVSVRIFVLDGPVPEVTRVGEQVTTCRQSTVLAVRRLLLLPVGRGLEVVPGDVGHHAFPERHAVDFNAAEIGEPNHVGELGGEVAAHRFFALALEEARARGRFAQQRDRGR
jgi:hypothetical protein